MCHRKGDLRRRPSELLSETGRRRRHCGGRILGSVLGTRRRKRARGRPHLACQIGKVPPKGPGRGCQLGDSGGCGREISV
ncbi:hypothetical protein AKJ09_03992 [Labilithrix luteola]|uniref:Uncharacterized protein n=1 Tax=Labilithrix luteola TaxID=1391654 RepID=A0A0K1PUX2_9BACT|nr:hypothetical protein AKJ09_03992 [Labilithrix luteola]